MSLSGFLQMADIIISILPAVDGRGSSRFNSHRQSRVPAIINSLEKEYHGEGILKDIAGVTLLREDDDVLEAGDHTFKLTSATAGIL